MISLEDVLRMAEQAKLLRCGDGYTEPYRWGLTEISVFANLCAEEGARKEREECARICDDLHYSWHFGDPSEPDSTSGPKECAKSIRARGKS